MIATCLCDCDSLSDGWVWTHWRDSLLAQLTAAQGARAGVCLLVDGARFLCSCLPGMDWAWGRVGLGTGLILVCAAKYWALTEGEFQDGICQ